jgi:hypothetical protein
MARSRPRLYAFLSKLLEPFTLAMMALVLLLCTSPRRLVLTWRGAATGAALLAVVASSWPPVRPVSASHVAGRARVPRPQQSETPSRLSQARASW